MELTRPAAIQPIPEHAKKVFSGVIYDVYQWQQKLYDGSETTFEKIKRVDTISVIPVNDRGEVVICKEQQPGYGTFYGTLGGRIEPGESPLEAAARELKEEAGLEAQTYVEWFSHQPVTKIDWVVYNLIAKGLKPSLGGQNLDKGENIELLYVTLDEWIEIAQQDDFRDKDIAYELLTCKLNQEKMDRLKKLLN